MITLILSTILVCLVISLAYIYVSRYVHKIVKKEYTPSWETDLSLVSGLWYIVINDILLEALFMAVAKLLLCVHLIWYGLQLLWHLSCKRVRKHMG